MRIAERYISFSISLSKTRSHQVSPDAFLFSIRKQYCTVNQLRHFLPKVLVVQLKGGRTTFILKGKMNTDEVEMT